MNEEDIFYQLVKNAIENKSDIAPDSPAEFDIYCDNHYNLHMFIKGEWSNTGLNVMQILHGRII